MKVLYMGTPEFAVATLRAIVHAGHTVVAVVTAPDKPSGRGLQVSEPAVKTAARELGLPVFQPEKLRDPDFIAAMQSLAPDIAVVVAFRMLPEAVWQIPRLGTLNLHASLLPDYRGAAPINRAIMNGETESGVTTFFIEKEIDTGNILLQEKVSIPAEWNAGDLHDALMHTGAALVVKTLEGLEHKQLKAYPQDPSQALHTAPKIFREDCEIHWNHSAKEIANLVRGLSPFPGAWTTFENKILKVYAGAALEGNAGPAGTVLSDQKSFLGFCTGAGIYRIDQLQPEGKKRMRTEDFLRGYKLNAFQPYPND